MKIAYLTTEAVPFAKTGGLADVCGALPARVAGLGHQAAVFMPAFRSVHSCGQKIEATDYSFAVPMSDRKVIGARLLKSTLIGSDVPVWMIDQPQYFDRESLYGTSTGDYPDNAERFAFFCRAAMIAISRVFPDPSVVHCNDWQTGLVPAIMNATPELHPWIENAASVLTIHNLAYQGQFSHDAFTWTGLSWKHFTATELEFYGQLNFLKAGIISADQVTTVSDRYSQEIRTIDHGCGLDGVLRSIGDRVHGIVNGIDDEVWNPATDTKLIANYDVTNWQSGKHANKRFLQSEFGLDESHETPLIGCIGRLASQKGWDLILQVIDWHLTQHRPTQWIVLGSGDAHYERELGRLAAKHAGRFALHLGFSDTLAHRIEAGSDLFVMPSQYEPCGLNQLYSLRYGAVPIVTATGGLADTVTDTNETTIAAGTATGFFVRSHDPYQLDQSIGNALRLRYHEPKTWEKIIQTGMTQDWSWRKSASQYVSLYEQSVALKARI